METEKKPKNNKLKLILMIVLPIILIISIGLGYMVVAEKSISDIKQLFEKEEEFTMPLEEFLVNIKSTAGKSRYLKIKLVLMYDNKKHGEVLIANVDRIRDIIIGNLRVKHTEEILDPEATDGIKKQIMEDINSNFNGDMVKDVYITDLIVQ